MSDFTAEELAVVERWLGKHIKHLERWYTPLDASYLLRLKSERRVVRSLMRGKLQSQHAAAGEGRRT